MGLKKEFNLVTLTLYGVGIILGAGVYAIIGAGAEIAGPMLWLSFLLAGIVAGFTGLSYVELSGRYTKEAAEYTYTKNAFNREWLSFLVGWIMVVAGVVSAAVVALGFGGYLSHLIGGNASPYAVAIIIGLSILNYVGIKESIRFNNIASIIEISGILLVIIIALLFGRETASVNYLEVPQSGVQGVFSAIGVIFFAFIGFEYIANISQEVQDSKKVVPKAITLALVISTILYVTLSLAIFLLSSTEELATSAAPLTTAVASVLPNAGFLISVIALFATSNTVLIILIGTSRILYGLARHGSLPKNLATLTKQGTPATSILLVGLAAASIGFVSDIKSVAALTDLGLFITYFFVNLALIQLRVQERKKFPILAALGALSCVFMMFHFQNEIWLLQAGIILAGCALFVAYKRKRRT